MLSPVAPDAQFQLGAQYPANLDRCRRCGNPRKLHSDDGSCGLALPQMVANPAPTGWKYRDRATRTIRAVAVLAALAGASWLLVTTQTATAGSAAAFAILVALIFLAAGAGYHRR
ncbi:MAG TPA: hypothetical protein VIZ00_04715 [Streptosporangiaceae bacterium]